MTNSKALLALSLAMMADVEMPRMFSPTSRAAYGTRGKVGTSTKTRERRKRERQNRKRGRK